MNSKQLQYAIELASTCNFSKASDNLNISQPALSKQILSLENELGVKLFERNCSPLRLTAAGEDFIKKAKELVYKEQQLRHSMDVFRSGKRGKIKIGVSPFRALYLIPDIAKQLSKRYPDIEIKISDTNSETIRKELSEGKLDFAIVNLPVDENIFEYTPIESDILVLAVPNQMLPLIKDAPEKEYDEISFPLCEKLPFIVVDETKEMRQLFDGLCEAADFEPKIKMEVVGLTLVWAMVQSGVGAAVLPLQLVEESSPLKNNVALFKIRNNTYRRQPVIITRRGQYLSEYAKYAIELLSKQKGE